MPPLTTIQQKTENIKTLMSSKAMQHQIALAAPKHLTADRITRVFMTSLLKTPKLALCTRESLMGSMLTCTQLGLEPDSAAQMAHLIPYGDVCTLIVGYKGLMALARRSGDIRSLDARVVYEDDYFEFEFGTAPKLKHVPDLLSDKRDPENIECVYAVAIMKDGGTQFDIMTKKDVNLIMARSKASAKGPWVTDWPEMARKTVIRRLCKYLPSSPELSQAVTLDEQAERGISQNIDFLDLEPAEGEPEAKGPPESLEDLTPDPAPKAKAKTKAKATSPNPQVEQLAVIEKIRAGLAADFAKLQPDQQKTFLRTCGLEAIERVAMEADVSVLESFRDAMMSA